MVPASNQVYKGVLFAVLATFIWSGNFIVARGVINDIPPITLAFFRWLCATIIILPFAWKSFTREKDKVTSRLHYFFWTSLFGVAIFNTFLYIAAHTTSAINMALIGTCSSPVFSIILAAIFLRERITTFSIIGILMCLAGVILLLVQGSLTRLINFEFTSGDIWVLGAAIFFAGYNIMVRKRPPGMHANTFLLVTFFIGTLQLLPFYVWEANHTAPVAWSGNLFLAVLYLGLGASVIAFLLWNSAIVKLGAGRTAMFGNLIPLFSSIEAVLILNEALSMIHLIAGTIIISGVVIANLKKYK